MLKFIFLGAIKKTFIAKAVGALLLSAPVAMIARGVIINQIAPNLSLWSGQTEDGVLLEATPSATPVTKNDRPYQYPSPSASFNQTPVPQNKNEEGVNQNEAQSEPLVSSSPVPATSSTPTPSPAVSTPTPTPPVVNEKPYPFTFHVYIPRPSQPYPNNQLGIDNTLIKVFNDTTGELIGSGTTFHGDATIYVPERTSLKIIAFPSSQGCGLVYYETSNTYVFGASMSMYINAENYQSSCVYE